MDFGSDWCLDVLWRMLTEGGLVGVKVPTLLSDRTERRTSYLSAAR